MSIPTRALISILALRNNFSIISNKVRVAGVETKNIICVVKADAYGHCAKIISTELVKLGVKWLAVSCMKEAIELREHGIKSNIIIFGPIQYVDIERAINENLVVCISCTEDIKLLKSLNINRNLKAIVNIDTGMGRMGLTLEQSNEAFNILTQITNIEVIGIMSHMSCADGTQPDDIEYTNNQINDFRLLVSSSKKIFKNIKLVSLANSSGILFKNNSIYNAPRPGIALYGVSPDNNLDIMDKFEPVMNVVTQIAQIRTHPEGACISYGRHTRLERQSNIALIPFGYEDGMQRKIEPGFELMVHGMPAPVIGSVTMDYTLIDVTDIEEAKVGDEVLVLGKRGNSEVRAETHALAAGTISYEILTSIGKRVKREITDS
jgi:alanine racemase